MSKGVAKRFDNHFRRNAVHGIIVALEMSDLRKEESSKQLDLYV